MVGCGLVEVGVNPRYLAIIAQVRDGCQCLTGGKIPRGSPYYGILPVLLQPLGPGLYLGMMPHGIDSEFAIPKALTAAGIHAIIRRQSNEGRGSPDDEKGRH